MAAQTRVRRTFRRTRAERPGLLVWRHAGPGPLTSVFVGQEARVERAATRIDPRDRGNPLLLAVGYDGPAARAASVRRSKRALNPQVSKLKQVSKSKEETYMSRWTPGVTLLSCVLLSSGPALAQTTTTEFSRDQTIEFRRRRLSQGRSRRKEHTAQQRDTRRPPAHVCLLF